MKMLLRAALVAGLCASSAGLAATASTTSAPSNNAPLGAPCVTQGDGTCSGVSPTNQLPTVDANSAAYLFATPMTSGLSYPLATFSQRGFYAICSAAGTATLTDTSGTTLAAFPLVVGLQIQPIKLASFASLTGTCSIGLLK